MSILLLSIAVAASAPIQPSQAAAPAMTYSPAVQRDLECLVLVLVGTGMQTDEKAKQAGIGEIWYFRGELEGDGPGIDFGRAIRDEFAAVASLSKAQVAEIGTRCDSQFKDRAAEMARMGTVLAQKPANSQ